MSLPKVVVTYGNGNLLQDIDTNGVTALVGSCHTSANLNKIFIIYNVDDAIEQGLTSTLEPDAFRHIKEFYDEVAGNMELRVLLLGADLTIAAMLDDTHADRARKLFTGSDGKIRRMGLFKTLPAEYDGGEDYIDDDVAAAITAAKTFGDARLAELQPCRIIIEGRVLIANEESTTIFAPNTGSNGWAGVVLGGSKNDGSASIGTALGRKAKYPEHIKVGKVSNGSLSLTQCYIGTKKIADMTNLEALHDKGYISFMTYAQKAGFFFGIDHMASNDDYRLWAYGETVDKAAVIAAAVYTEQVESEVDITADGKISELDLNHLKGIIEQQIQIRMADQISSLDVYINPDQNVIDTNKLTIKLSITPKGYTSEIDIEIGLNSPALNN